MILKQITLLMNDFFHDDWFYERLQTLQYCQSNQTLALNNKNKEWFYKLLKKENLNNIRSNYSDKQIAFTLQLEIHFIVLKKLFYN